MSASAALDESVLDRETPARVVWRLAWPAVALNSLQVINNLLDRGFIGHLESSAVTGHSASTNVIFMMFSLAVSFAAAATALVSRAFGAGEHDEVQTASRQSLNLAVFLGLAIAVLTAVIAAPVSHLILPKDDPASQMQMASFVFIFAFGLPAIFVIQTIAGCLRGVGDTVSPMVISGMQILLHITLNFLLVFPTRHFGAITIPGADMGLRGAATALATSATISALIYVIYVGRTPLGSLWRIRLPQPEWARRILRIALPAATMSALRVLSLMAFTVVLSLVPDGSNAIAAMGIAFAIESIMFMPSFGLAAAAGALVGQSLGMKRPDRASVLGWTAAHHGAIVTLTVAGPIYLTAPSIASLLLDDKAEMIRQATSLIRFLCATEVLFAYATILFGAMQGAGDTVRPLWISMFCLWGLRVPLAFCCALPAGFALAPWLHLPVGLALGSRGAWFAMSFTQGLQGVLGLFVFKRGRWKTVKV
jgi:putative MATE family efflux protein